MPRSSVYPSLGTDSVKFFTPGNSETPCDGDNVSIDVLASQADFHIKAEVHRELRTHWDLSPEEFARVKQSQLKKLLFYRLVLGGNVDIVSSILGEIRQIDKALHNYLITGKREINEMSQCDKQNESASCFFVFKSLMIYSLIMIPLFIITTPIFYAMHSLFVRMYTNRKLSKFSKYPLLFAAISNSQTMLQLFAEHHSDILSDTDKEGNNIFHYLAEISIKKPQRAIQCFKLIKKTFTCYRIRYVLLEANNFNGLTALEQSILKGSPLYFTLLLETNGILKSRALSISNNFAYSNRTTTAKSIDARSVMLQEFSSPSYYDKSDKSVCIRGKRNFKSALYTLFHYDITKYEQGDVFGDNSFLLTLITRRNVITMLDSEVESIASSSFLTRWMRIKTKSVTTIRNLQFTVSNIVVQVFGLYAMMIAGTDNSERLIISFWSTVNRLAIDNETYTYNTSHKISSNTTFVALSDFISPALNILNTACGFDVSSHLTIGNNTKLVQEDTPLSIVWLISGFIALVSIIAVLSDLYLRLVFLTKNFYHSDWRKGHPEHSLMIRRVMARPMQVSYVERQLLNLSYIFCGLMMYCLSRSQKIAAIDVDSANEKSILRTVGMMIAVACMSTRFFALVYTSRAAESMNVAGRFVLTMCKMFSFIIEFSWVYLWVATFFAGIFLFVVYDPVCTYNSYYPFDSFPGSIMGVFRLMLSDNILPERPSLEATFTYVIYITLTSIIILSLVTGISGSIADKVLGKNIINILTTVESLESAIEAESSSYICPLRLFKYFHIKRMKNGHKIISMIDKQSNIVKVAIEVESFSPSLSAQNEN